MRGGELIFIGEPRASGELEMETGKIQASWEGQRSWESGVGMTLQAKQGQMLKGQDWLPQCAVDAFKVGRS